MGVGETPIVPCDIITWDKEKAMTVTDGDRLAVAMTQLSQAREAVRQATKIIEHLFELGKPQSCAWVPTEDHRDDRGLYEGQLSDPTLEVELECED